MPRLAVVLHGKVGDVDSLLPGARARPLRAVENAQASAHLAVLCALSTLRHVVQHNAQQLHVDTFGHSWSPSIGAVLDAVYQPLRSAHESPPRLACPLAGFIPGFCVRTLSHIRGVGRALGLKRSYERERGFLYDWVFLSRWDVLWQRPLRIEQLPGFDAPLARRRDMVWLPRICVPITTGNVGHSLRAAVCGGANGAWSAPQAANECSPAARACAPDMAAEAREMYEMDWWLLFGSSEQADAFAQMDARFLEIGELVRARLSAKPQGVIAMGHAWYGIQLLWHMRAQLQYTLDIGVEFHLGRAWRFFRCPGLAPPHAKVACDAGDIPSRPWHDAALRARWTAASVPPRVTFPSNGTASMQASCHDRYFYCETASRMCDSYEADGDPMDRRAARALYLGCAEGLCAANGSAAPGSTACAGQMIDLWLQVAELSRNRTEREHGQAPRSAGRKSLHSNDHSFRVLARRLTGNAPMGSTRGILSTSCQNALLKPGAGLKMPLFT
ncbi:hypothetical protein AB1Y20_015633 [Prymnesium parvum]|uniref:Uncharacterized protein n=1 Tax=Prymnesium parvum TaxID=97485 RepID=A0AB34K1E2_PRYPA